MQRSPRTCYCQTLLLVCYQIMILYDFKISASSQTSPTRWQLRIRVLLPCPRPGRYRSPLLYGDDRFRDLQVSCPTPTGGKRRRVAVTTLIRYRTVERWRPGRSDTEISPITKSTSRGNSKGYIDPPTIPTRRDTDHPLSRVRYSRGVIPTYDLKTLEKWL